MPDLDLVPDAKLRDLFSDALDEVFRLRSALAYEAVVLREHLTFKTFPKSRRRYGEDQVERMFTAARGKVNHAYGMTSHMSIDHWMREAVAPKQLTVGEWAGTQPAPRMPLRSRAVGAEEAEQLRSDLDRAVREIDSLRRGIAHEAAVLIVHANCSTFPKSRAVITGVQATRMRAAARGESVTAYGGDMATVTKRSLADAGANQTLTVTQWSAEQPRCRR